MTRQIVPRICDVCGKRITSEMQYMFEVYQGTTTFGDEVIQGKSMDICHTDFLKFCKTSHYKPQWIKKQKNPNWVRGSKKPEEKFFLVSDLQE